MSVAVVKDCADIWTRLFDHRPFLNGEIKLFLKEFEESRADREITKLFDILEWTTDVRDNQIDKANESSCKLDKLNTLLEISLQNSNTVLESEGNYSIDCALKGKRSMRKVEWEKFMKEIAVLYAKTDDTFKNKEEELKEFYRDLEEKLHIN